jgi:hypothetical protein
MFKLCQVYFHAAKFKKARYAITNTISLAKSLQGEDGMDVQELEEMLREIYVIFEEHPSELTDSTASDEEEDLNIE